MPAIILVSRIPGGKYTESSCLRLSWIVCVLAVESYQTADRSRTLTSGVMFDCRLTIASVSGCLFLDLLIQDLVG